MRVVVAPDSYGGVLSARDAASAIADAWRTVRPDDEVVERPMSDGGTGFADVLRGNAQPRRCEVAGPRGLPVEAVWYERTDGTAVIESAEACGLHLVRNDDADPRTTTTWGVGQLLDDARRRGVSRMLVGLGGSATVDGGAGALSGLGFRLTVADGSGLKIGGEDLPRVRNAATGWADDAWFQGGAPEVLLLADTATPLVDAAARFGPQKGAGTAGVAHLEEGLAAWAEVAAQDLEAPGLATSWGSGAAGGLAFGLAAGLPTAHIVRGAAVVADEGHLDGLDRADLVVTGEGRLDDASFDGKVIGEVSARGAAAGVPVVAIVGEDVTTVAHPIGVHLLPGTHVSGDRDLALERIRRAAAAVARAQVG